jgi:predicted Rossmann fold nucleotide-binding protein DprA/Smf involved in DNA uptake
MTKKYLHKLPRDFTRDKNKNYVAVIGSRTITDEKIVYTFIKSIFDNFDDIIIVSGGAAGVDAAAEFFADDYNIDIIVIKPDWKKYGKCAGMLRNKSIIDLADTVIAVQKNNSLGTQNSINLAKKAQKKLYVKQI